jgi:CubicO group peptidase (beta-lactamase class C family)
MKKLYILVLSCIFYSACSQQKYSPEVEEQIKQVENNICGRVIIEGESQNILDRMAFYKVKGLSIAVVSNYKVVWAKGYGWADEAEKRPVTAETLFEPGSISKSLNAVGVLKLVQDKKLDLDKDINMYLKSWKFPYDSISKNKKITLAHLLSHSAGLTVHGFPGYDRKDQLPTLPEVLDGKQPANTPAVRSFMEPGVKFQYSGGGTSISQLIIQDVTQQPYDKFMYENVLKPMGMQNSFYSQPPPDDKVKLCATGYYQNGVAVNNKFHVYPEQGAAGLWMTPSDLCNYIIETQLAYEGRSAKVLNQEMVKLHLTPYNDRALGLGVFLEDRNGTTYFNHNAGNEGFSGSYYGSLDGKGNGIAVFLNNTSSPIMYEVINSVARAYNWKNFPKAPESRKFVTVPDKVMETYLGVYSALPNTFVNIVRREDGYYQFAEGMHCKMYFTSDTEYFVKEFDNDKHFIKDATGKVTGYYRTMNGKTLEPRHVKIVRLDTLKGNEQFFNDIGWSFLENKCFTDATKYLERGMEVYPQALAMKINLAHSYLFNKNYEKAITIYKTHIHDDLNKDFTWKKMMFQDFIFFKNNGLDKAVMDKVIAELKLQMPEGY